MAAVRPMLAVSQGRLIALSTPAGKRGWFYEAWIGGDSWHRVKVAATDCPRISQAFLDEELRELGARNDSVRNISLRGSILTKPCSQAQLLTHDAPP